jgi:hypothetical protein
LYAETKRVAMAALVLAGSDDKGASEHSSGWRLS